MLIQPGARGAAVATSKASTAAAAGRPAAGPGPAAPSPALANSPVAGSKSTQPTHDVSKKEAGAPGLYHGLYIEPPEDGAEGGCGLGVLEPQPCASPVLWEEQERGRGRGQQQQLQKHMQHRQQQQQQQSSRARLGRDSRDRGQQQLGRGGAGRGSKQRSQQEEPLGKCRGAGHRDTQQREDVGYTSRALQLQKEDGNQRDWAAGEGSSAAEGEVLQTTPWLVEGESLEPPPSAADGGHNKAGGKGQDGEEVQQRDKQQQNEARRRQLQKQMEQEEQQWLAGKKEQHVQLQQAGAAGVGDGYQEKEERSMTQLQQQQMVQDVARKQQQEQLQKEEDAWQQHQLSQLGQKRNIRQQQQQKQLSTVSSYQTPADGGRGRSRTTKSVGGNMCRQLQGLRESIMSAGHVRWPPASCDELALAEQQEQELLEELQQLDLMQEASAMGKATAPGAAHVRGYAARHAVQGSSRCSSRASNSSRSSSKATRGLMSPGGGFGSSVRGSAGTWGRGSCPGSVDDSILSQQEPVAAGTGKHIHLKRSTEQQQQQEQRQPQEDFRIQANWFSERSQSVDRHDGDCAGTRPKDTKLYRSASAGVAGRRGDSLHGDAALQEKEACTSAGAAGCGISLSNRRLSADGQVLSRRMTGAAKGLAAAAVEAVAAHPPMQAGRQQHGVLRSFSSPLRGSPGAAAAPQPRSSAQGMQGTAGQFHRSRSMQGAAQLSMWQQQQGVRDQLVQQQRHGSLQNQHIGEGGGCFQQEEQYLAVDAAAPHSRKKSQSNSLFPSSTSAATNRLQPHHNQIRLAQAAARVEEWSSDDDEGGPGSRAGGSEVLTPTARQAALQRLKALRGAGPWAMALPKWAA